MTAFPALETIQTCVAPVVMISANGLLCLAFYNRLSALANRSRAMNKERFDLAIRLGTLAADRPTEAAGLRQRVEILDELGHQLLARAGWVRATLVCLLLSVLCMLGCSLSLGLVPLAPAMARAALVLFVGGTLVMMLGVATAIHELRLALHPLTFEHQRIELQASAAMTEPRS
jgi:hypothetical protein